MVYCSKCGKENPPESTYCNACGVRLYNGEAMSAPATVQSVSIATPVKPAKKRSFLTKPWAEQTSGEKGANVLIVLIIFVVVIAFVFSMLVGTGWFGSGATAHITVQSSHPLNTVTVEVYVGKVKIAEETVGPLGRLTVDYKPMMWFSDTDTFSIKAVSYGGGLGEMHDYKTITLNKGDVINVHLLV